MVDKTNFLELNSVTSSALLFLPQIHPPLADLPQENLLHKKARKEGETKVKMLKDLLKAIRMNESTISMILGVLVIVVVGVLIVNYFRTRSQITPSISVPAGQAIPVTPAPAQFTGELPQKHQVQKGENLWKIAEYYYESGYNWVDIAKENQLANPDGLAIGQTLTIPDVTAKTATIAELPKTGTVQITNPIEGSSYTIQRGDNLWNIAVRAYGDGYQWVKIAQTNQLENPNLIHAGNQLEIPR